MSVNNIENNFNPTDKIFDGYKPDVSFFEEKTRDDLIIDHYQNSVPTNLDYSLAPDFSVNLSFLKNQSFQVYDYIEQAIKSIEELLIKVVYINEEITPDMEECHTKLWEELCKYNDIEMSEPEFVCFEEYKYAERSTSTVARRFIAEFNQICSQSVFSSLLNYRSLLKAM